MKESKITLEDQPKKSSELDTDDITGGSTNFSKRSGTSKGLASTDPWSKNSMNKQHEDLLARPATEFIQSQEIHEIQMPGAIKKKPSKLKPLGGGKSKKRPDFNNIAE